MAFSKVKVGGLADDSVTAANIDDDGTGYTVGNLTNSGTLQQTGQVTFGTGSGSGGSWTLPTSRGANDKYVLQIDTTAGAANWVESLVAPEISSHNFDVSGSTDDGGINDYEAPYAYTGTTTNASTTISSLSSTTGLLAGQYISGAGIPANTTISSVNSGASTIVISNQATAAASGVALKIQKTPGEKNGGKVTLSGTNFGTNIADISVAITTSGGGVIANASYLSGLSGTSITAEWTGTEGSYSTDLTSSYDGKVYFKITKSGLASNVYDTGATLTSDATVTELSTSSQTGGERAVAPSATSLGSYGSGQVAGGGNERETRLLLNFDRFGGKEVEDSSNTGDDGHKVVSTNAVIKGSPFGDGKTGMYFDGSDDRVAIPNHADFTVGGTNPWSIDFWVCADLSDYGGFTSITDVGANDVSSAITTLTVYMDNSSPKQLHVYIDDNNSGWTIMSGDAGFRFNDDLRWHHIAVTYGGNPADEVYRVYVDGILLKATAHSSQMYSSSGNQGLVLGCNDSGSAHFKGYLDELRWVVGENPFPIGSMDKQAFVPSQYRYGTTGATHEVSTAANMKALIRSNRFDDDSDSHHPLVVTGPTAITASPARTNWGGSTWDFNGTDGNYMYLPKSIDWDLGTGADWTLECWARMDATGSWKRIVSIADKGDWNGWALHSNNAQQMQFGHDKDSIILSGGTSTAITQNEWHHWAVTYTHSNTTLKMYRDGIEALSSTTAINWTKSNTNLLIGARSVSGGSGALNEIGSGPNYVWPGQIEDLRITRGLAVYTGNFNVPTSSLTTTWAANPYGTAGSKTGQVANSDSSKVKCLILGDNGKFEDSATSGTTHTPVATGALHSNGHLGRPPALAWPASGKRTGTSGVYFDTADQKLTISTPSGGGVNAAFAGTGSWFWEGWIYYIYQGANAFRVFFTSRSSNVVTALVLAIDETNDQLDILLGGSGAWHIDAYVNNTSAKSVLQNKWNHLLVQRHGANIDVYLNGIKKTLAGNDSTLGSGNSLDAAATMTLGDDDAGNSSFYGYLDNVRIGTGTPTTDSTDPLFTNGQTSTSSNNYVNGLPTKVYGAFGSEKPDVGTITLTATGSGDYTWSEMSQGTALPGTLAVGSTTHSGSGDSRTHTATITGAFTSGVTSDTTTNGILLKAQNDADATKAITLGSSGGYDGINIIQKSTGRPTLFNGRRFHGSQTTKSITGYGFAPDLIWAKSRTSAWHQMHDTVRGISGTGAGVLYPNDASIAETGSAIQSYDSDGFTLHATRSGSINSDNGIIAWGWKAGGAPSGSALSLSGGIGAGTISSGLTNITNVTQTVNQNTGFSITRFRGAANGGSFPHNLGGAPSWVIIKNITNENSVGSQEWAVWHKNLTATTGKAIFLSTGAVEGSTSGYFDYSGVDMGSNTTLISVGSNDVQGGGVADYICYAWRAIPGVSAFGVYTGQQNGNPSSSDPTYCGFKPSMVILKKRDGSTGSWRIFDKFRSTGDTWTLNLNPDDPSAEATENNVSVTVYDNGFATGSDSAITGDNIIWMAFA